MFLSKCSSQSPEDNFPSLCLRLSSKPQTSPEDSRTLSGEGHSTGFEVQLELLDCKPCISRRFLLSSFFGHVGLMHKVQGRFPGMRTNKIGQPQVLHVLPVGFTMPLWGSGNEVLQMLWK